MAERRSAPAGGSITIWAVAVYCGVISRLAAAARHTASAALAAIQRQRARR